MASEGNLRVELKSQQPSRNSAQHDATKSSHICPLEMLLHRLKAAKTNQDGKFASIMDALGEFGTFQRRLVTLTFLPIILAAFFTFADIFVFTAQKPYCNTSWILAVGPNLSEAEQLNLTLPRDTNGSLMTCLMYLPVTWDLESIVQFGLNYTQACQDGWIYPESKMRSLINEFDLVCGEEINVDIVLTIGQAGLLIGSLLFGFISDRLGRYPSILLSILGMIIFGFGTAFVNSFQQYLFFRFGALQALMGYIISSVALATEWLMGEHRAHAVILEHCFFSLGILFLAGLAYSLPHWRLLFLLGGAPVFSLISYIWILPESPRWLITKGKVEEAKQVLCYAAGVNKKQIPLNLLDKLQVSEQKMPKASVLDFYNNRHLRKVALVMGCVWFTASHSYFTLSFKMKDFGVNIYFSQVIPGIVEVPAQLCCIFLLEQIGRKWSLAVTLFQATFMNLLILIFPSEFKSIMALMVLLGQFSLAASVTVFFVYTAELLPTVLRATGLGLLYLAWVAGAILSLTLISQNLTISSSLCCISAICALALCSMLPETRDKPLSDTLEHYSLETRSKSKNLITEDTIYDNKTEELAKNTLLNRMTNVDSGATSSRRND
ncbi:solute carrier family 22 member 14 [Pteronotus mesoamericanus]|uniref:solute carrier family 22 member 14 n=1 Tax=Pteronotus mesoamericanus TaxID=1884717 RepID=UPI0023ED0B76|nr:solute carrier family 22 member 14 [Pteronotus parnellii mesoamericanus]